MTMTYVLRSWMKRKFHVQFCSGGRAGDRPADHNPADLPYDASLTVVFCYQSSWVIKQIFFSRSRLKRNVSCIEAGKRGV
jgi:hypothetical protein